MAKIIENSSEAQIIGLSYPLLGNVLIGVILGLLYYGVVFLIGNYNSSVNVSGGIATIITATVGVIIMARYYMSQVLIVNLAVGIALWGLSSWTSGLIWLEAVGWSVLLYALAYVLFSWVSRFTKVMPVIISVAVIIIAARIASAL